MLKNQEYKGHSTIRKSIIGVCQGVNTKNVFYTFTNILVLLSALISEAFFWSEWYVKHGPMTALTQKISDCWILRPKQTYYVCSEAQER